MTEHGATHALILGGTQGLGLAIARRLKAEGCTKLVITGRDNEKGTAVAAGLGASFMAADPGATVAQALRHHHGADDNWLARAEVAQPFGMLVKPAHVAGLASYMPSKASGVMTGAWSISIRTSQGPILNNTTP